MIPTWKDFLRWRKKSRRESISNVAAAVVAVAAEVFVVVAVVAVVVFPALSSLLLTRHRMWSCPKTLTPK